jgi:hypothetical protein
MLTTTKPDLLPLGVHFGLDEIEHHLDPAIGSSDLKRLLLSQTSYWWYSWMNPSRPPVDKTTTDREEGKAIHKIVLEGVPGFKAAYLRRPDDREDASGSEKGILTKEWNKKAAASGLKLLHGDAFDRAAFVGAAIAANPHLAEAFHGGMPEVTIIWVDASGIRRKARIDYLKIVGIGDLKTIVNEREREFKAACRLQMRQLKMPLQAVYYMEGRAQLPKLVAEGLVHGDHDPGWLKKVAASKVFAWQWVFYQKSHAPQVWSTKLSPQNPFVRELQDDVRVALDRFTDGMKRFGAEQAWMDHEVPEELHKDDLTYIDY